MRILITGSRDWDDTATITEALQDVWESYDCPPAPTLVSGACPTGADHIAETHWQSLGHPIERHPADWHAHGRAAGPRRNQAMVDAGADVCLAFIRDDSRGATQCANAAERAGIPTIRYYDNSPHHDPAAVARTQP